LAGVEVILKSISLLKMLPLGLPKRRKYLFTWQDFVHFYISLKWYFL